MNDDQLLGAFSEEETILVQSGEHFQRMLDDIPNVQWGFAHLNEDAPPILSDLEALENSLEPPEHGDRRTTTLIQHMALSLLDEGLNRPSGPMVGADLFTASEILQRTLEQEGIRSPKPHTLNSSTLFSHETDTSPSAFRLSGSQAASFLRLEALEGTDGSTYTHYDQSLPVANVIDAAWLAQMLLGPQFAHIAHPADVDSTTSILAALACYGLVISEVQTDPASINWDVDRFDNRLVMSSHAQKPRPTLLVTRPDLVMYWVRKLTAITYCDQDMHRPSFDVKISFGRDKDIRTLEGSEEQLDKIRSWKLARTVAVKTPQSWLEHSRRMAHPSLPETDEHSSEGRKERSWIRTVPFGITILSHVLDSGPACFADTARLCWVSSLTVPLWHR